MDKTMLFTLLIMSRSQPKGSITLCKVGYTLGTYNLYFLCVLKPPRASSVKIKVFKNGSKNMTAFL